MIKLERQLFHEKIPNSLLQYELEKANEYNINNCNLYYLTKNPKKYGDLLSFLNPETNWIGATIETDSYNFQKKFQEKCFLSSMEITSAPSPEKRINDFKKIKYPKKYLSIEPVIKFSDDFIRKIINS